MQVATSLQYAWSDLGEADHDAVGPDALDTILWGLKYGREVIEQPKDGPDWETKIDVNVRAVRKRFGSLPG
jgi:hypothetical protein